MFCKAETLSVFWKLRLTWNMRVKIESLRPSLQRARMIFSLKVYDHNVWGFDRKGEGHLSTRMFITSRPVPNETSNMVTFGEVPELCKQKKSSGWKTAHVQWVASVTNIFLSFCRNKSEIFVSTCIVKWSTRLHYTNYLSNSVLLAL